MYHNKNFHTHTNRHAQALLTQGCVLINKYGPWSPPIPPRNKQHPPSTNRDKDLHKNDLK